MSPNPFARARRLGAALKQLRDQLGYSHAELSALSGVSAASISRMENPVGAIGRSANLRLLRRVLDALGVERGSAQWLELERYAEDVTGGWWDAEELRHMGTGQRDAAIVEHGASEIREYSGLLLPGLVQTAAYARHRAQDDPHVDAIVAGRLARQRILESADYHLVLEPQSVRRYPVPPAVMLDQLHHLLELAARPNISIQVLRVDGRGDAGTTPRAPFAHISYPDRADPRIVTVDNATGDMLVTGAAEVEGYAQLHQRLRNAAMSDADSAAIIKEVAGKLAAEI